MQCCVYKTTLHFPVTFEPIPGSKTQNLNPKPFFASSLHYDACKLNPQPPTNSIKCDQQNPSNCLYQPNARHKKNSEEAKPWKRIEASQKFSRISFTKTQNPQPFASSLHYDTSKLNPRPPSNSIKCEQQNFP